MNHRTITQHPNIQGSNSGFGEQNEFVRWGKPSIERKGRYEFLRINTTSEFRIHRCNYCSCHRCSQWHSSRVILRSAVELVLIIVVVVGLTIADAAAVTAITVAVSLRRIEEYLREFLNDFHVEASGGKSETHCKVRAGFKNHVRRTNQRAHHVEPIDPHYGKQEKTQGDSQARAEFFNVITRSFVVAAVIAAPRPRNARTIESNLPAHSAFAEINGT